MNWKGLEGSCRNLLEIHFRNFSGGAEEFHKKPPSVRIACVTTGIESSTSQIQVSNVTSRKTSLVISETSQEAEVACPAICPS
jgi:hypothetical protein